MLTAFLSTVALLSASALAQSATSSATAAGATHTVVVGSGGLLQYAPNNTVASIGDFVTFVFGGKNHSVTQSTFASPCALIPQNTTTGAVGFDSGFVPASATNMSAFTIQVKAATPIWFYCAQTGHCPSGMVGSINAPATGNTFDAYLANALKSSTATAASASAGVTSAAAATGGVGGTLATGVSADSGSGASGSVSVAGATPSGSASRNVVGLVATGLLGMAACMLLA